MESTLEGLVMQYGEDRYPSLRIEHFALLN